MKKTKKTDKYNDIIINDNLKNSITLNDTIKKKIDYTIMDMDCETLHIQLKENITNNNINYDDQIINMYKPKFNLITTNIRNKIKYYHLFFIYQIDRILFNIFEVIFCYVFQSINYDINKYIPILKKLYEYKKILENIMNDVYIEKKTNIIKGNLCVNSTDFINDFSINNITNILDELLKEVDIIQTYTLIHCEKFKFDTT